MQILEMKVENMTSVCILISITTQSIAHTLWLDFVYHLIELILIGSNIEDRKCVRCAYCWVDVYSNIEDCKYFDRKKNKKDLTKWKLLVDVNKLQKTSRTLP